MYKSGKIIEGNTSHRMGPYDTVKVGPVPDGADPLDATKSSESSFQIIPPETEIQIDFNKVSKLIGAMQGDLVPDGVVQGKVIEEDAKRQKVPALPIDKIPRPTVIGTPVPTPKSSK